MSETLALEDKPTQERLATESPEVHEALKHLPPHVIEHVGSIALKLSHLDMHPTVEREYQGATYREKDYSSRILESENPEVEFEQESIEAARSGQEKLSEILHMSSATLALAHAALVARGYSFEATPNETDDELKKRQLKERRDIAEAAYKIATDRAIELKNSGNQLALIEQLESLNTIIFLAGERYGDKGAAKVSRKLIREGMAQDIVTALNESSKIKSSNYDNVGSALSSQKTILELATGKKLDYDFNVTGDLELASLTRIEGQSPLLDVITLVTSPKVGMSEQARHELVDKMSGWTQQAKLKTHLDKLNSYADGGNIYDVAEACDAEGDFNSNISLMLEFDEPEQVKIYSEKLGLSLLKTSILLGRRPEGVYDRRYIDTNVADQAVIFAEKFPRAMELILSDNTIREPRDNYESLIKSLEEIEKYGIEDEGVIKYLLLQRPEKLALATDAVSRAFEYARNHNFSESEFLEKLKYGEYGDNFYSKIVDLLDNYKDSESSQEVVSRGVESTIESLMIDSALNKTYEDLYKKVHYPATPDSVKTIRLGIDSFPEIASQLRGLGLDEDISRAIFTSWATFNALQKHGFNNESGFVTIKEMPSADVMNGIVREQANAIKGQLEALKKYHTEYGPEELKEIISTFGIYNFNRHSVKGLHDQLERWRSGQVAVNVVAEARADWNSYTGKPVKFEDESEKVGTFYFEVNSSLELSRLAVMIGQRERQNGREPDVNRFVVHAHGNPTKMLLGVNGESIELQQYKDAASSRDKLNKTSNMSSGDASKKISERETNSYRRHLGPNFKVILQSCSTAGSTFGKNIASTMAESHNTSVTGAVDTITGLTIKADGSVEYEAGYKETVGSITYDS